MTEEKRMNMTANQQQEVGNQPLNNVADQASASREASGHGISRRRMLKVLGLGGVMLAGSALGSKVLAAEETISRDPEASLTSAGRSGIIYVPTISELLNLPPGQYKKGTAVYVGGYHREGDGGGKWVRWDADSTLQDNGGTVHAPGRGNSRGRWVAVHNGVADFRWFGVLDAGTNADQALEAMVNDPSIHRIEAHTDLNFVRRHTFHRSGVELDFHGHTVTTRDIALNTPNNPFGAVIFFQGQPTGATQSVTLSKEIAELSDILEVADASAFQVNDWWRARISNHPGGREQRELDYLLMVTEIMDNRHIRVNYKIGWSLAAGRTIEYTQINPVFNSHVRNMNFIGVPVPPSESTSVPPFDTWDQIGSNPVAYEFAVRCDVSGIRAAQVFWPVIQRRYCTHYVTERCELYNPEERDWGGTGYLTQQLNVLYAHVKDCNTSNARHLNDFTCAAYCLVENCHGDGDDYGPFVTHGQFEHDLVYIGNSGLMSFANSGVTWGDSAKRITVKKHTASRIVVNKRITDLTLEDVHVYVKPGLDNSGSIWANVDGLQLRGCTAQAMLTLSQGSSRSMRPNILENCSFVMVKGYEIARPVRTQSLGFTPTSANLRIVNCEFLNVEDVNIGSINRLELINTWFRGTSANSGRIAIGSKEIYIQGGGFADCGMVFTGAWDKAETGTARQEVTIAGGTECRGTNGEKAFFKSAQPDNDVVWRLSHYSSTASDGETAHLALVGGGHQLSMIGCRLTGGKYEVKPGSIPAGSSLYIASCLEAGVNRTMLPPEGDRIKHTEGNMIIP
ncbi:hypothetical protein [Paenibacillus senegalensis]|uniref:hypothetical protein n=1 Tax=Paenibacillus senegalensis TaxID=1465766 RepID=UPI000287D6CF|nr:hypothetical protein [Paenibacillus senegalensis]